MFKWESIGYKDAWQILVWFCIFTYIPVIPAYYIISLKGLLGLTSLIYVILSLYVIYKIYLRFEKHKNIKES